jgi:L-alanine-DL-glutamate epimerase-like enolase superfamily enzyme
MRIVDVEALHLRIPDIAEVADGTQDVLLVRVTSDSGLHGIGEVSSSSYVCKAIIEAPRSAKRRHRLREIVVGSELNSVSDIEALWATMYHQTNMVV